MKIIFLLAIVPCVFPFSTNKAPAGWNWIPLINGNFTLMSDAEIESFVDPEGYAYNAYKDMKFLLFTRENPNTPQEVKIDDIESLRASNFNPKHPTRMFTHGWGGNGFSDGTVILPMRGYIQKGEYNVFTVDWSKGDSVNYVLARKRSNETGVVIGQFIEFLVREGKTSMNDIYIGGFSIGGQIVGYAGKYLKGQLPVIFGVDPAGPLFLTSDENNRLVETDAKYVEVIHTSGNLLGHDRPCGHVDFYANGGKQQPGCILDVTGSCAHIRAILYFAEAINSDEGFWGLKCKDRDDVTTEGCSTATETVRRMGQDPINLQSVKGVYSFQTNKKEPFAVGMPLSR